MNETKGEDLKMRTISKFDQKLAISEPLRMQNIPILLVMLTLRVMDFDSAYLLSWSMVTYGVKSHRLR